MIYRFTIPGTPQGKARPRLGRGHVYTPQKTKDYEEQIGWLAKEAGVEPTDGQVAVSIIATFLKRADKKPDADNIAKIVLDALNGIAYHDDTQVTHLHVFKLVGSEESVLVTIKTPEG